MSLQVKEIFRTIQGEGIFSGCPCVLLRLSGCNLRCSWCDTTYAYEGGRRYKVETLVSKIRKMDEGLVLVTGGEPMLQSDTVDLLDKLADAGSRVILETNGSLPLRRVPEQVHIVMDIKCPGSGEESSNDWSNLKYIKQDDEIKFVLADRKDYLWAVRRIREHGLVQRAIVNLSPVFGRLDPGTLAEWILRDGIPVRISLQLHKIIWKDADKGR